MRSVGFRAEANGFNWAVVDGTANAPVLIAADSATAPKTYTEAEALSWSRDRALHIIDQYKPRVAGVRYPEPISRFHTDSTRKRCRVEGVILEAATTRSLTIVTGALVTISKHLGSKSAKDYLTAEDLRGLDWSRYDKNVREAILAAASAIGAIQ